MAYSIVSILAIAVIFIVNIDVFFTKDGRSFRGGKYYLLFLLSVVLFLAVDIFWGVAYDINKSVVGSYIDAVLYFIAIALTVLMWGLFMYKYLDKKNRFVQSVFYIGLVTFVVQIGIIIVNFFVPIIFSISDDCAFTSLPFRYVILGLHVVMLVLTTSYSLYEAVVDNGVSRKRHIAIFSFGILMAVFSSIQMFLYNIPMNSTGFLLGLVALHTFVIEEQKYEKKLELDQTKFLVTVDALTGVKSKHVYVDIESEIDHLIAEGKMNDFAVVMFDLNGLKAINDAYGHEAGDIYIKSGVRLISNIFTNTPIYRIGGDEFVVILEDGNYDKRDELLKEFEEAVDHNKENKGVIISSGMSIYIKETDNTFSQVFVRADKSMYERKHRLKGERL